MEIKIQTLTPLWTGGVDGSMDRIHETSIIGSMHWWYEAIVRGLACHACDPTTDNKCRYDPKDSRPSDEQLCPVCHEFGATGWRRRFRLNVVEDRTKPSWTPEGRMLNIRPPDRTRGWFLPSGRMGTLVLRFTGDESSLNLLAALFLFLEKWGNLGAKPQLGYGVFEILNRDEVRMRAASFTWRILDTFPIDPVLPDLRKFGFFRYQFRPKKSVWWTRVPGVERVAVQAQPLITIYKIVPVAPALKNEWRFHHRWPELEEKLMFGTLQWRRWNNEKQKYENARVRSKLSLSWAYKAEKDWEVRGWIWMQTLGIASEIWNLIQDETCWQMAITSKGSVDVHYRNEWTAEKVAQFLEATK